MRQSQLILFSLICLLSCKNDSKIEPNEVEATLTGYVIADYWSKGCSAGGLQIKVGNDYHTISNHLSADYEEPNAWPIPVWVRYESAPPDSCAQDTNRINLLSIRKRP